MKKPGSGNTPSASYLVTLVYPCLLPATLLLPVLVNRYYKTVAGRLAIQNRFWKFVLRATFKESSLVHQGTTPLPIWRPSRERGSWMRPCFLGSSAKSPGSVHPASSASYGVRSSLGSFRSPSLSLLPGSEGTYYRRKVNNECDYV